MPIYIKAPIINPITNPNPNYWRTRMSERETDRQKKGERERERECVFVMFSTYSSIVATMSS